MPFSTKHKMVERNDNPTFSNGEQELILNAVNAGIDHYIQTRKAKVAIFVEEHFSLSGALNLHRKALGKDLYKAPLNILWLAPYTLSRACSFGLKKINLNKLANKLDTLPSGFETDVQKEINWFLYTELLELPYSQNGRTSTKDALLETILQDKQLANLIDCYLVEIHKKSSEQNFRQTLERNLLQYATTRAAAAELAGNIVTLCSSYAAFHQASPGVFTASAATATAIAQKIAIAQFWLGPTLGSWYYALFPTAASTGLVISSIGTMMVAFGILTTFTGIITDPLQAKLGMHQKRLNKFIDALAEEIKDKQGKHYAIKEIYINRVFDIVDILMAALRS